MVGQLYHNQYKEKIKHDVTSSVAGSPSDKNYYHGRFPRLKVRSDSKNVGHKTQNYNINISKTFKK